MDKTGPLNLYGDRLMATTGRHGADIATQRMDELDKACIKFALDATETQSAVDIGCGLGIQGARLALLGCETFLIDMLDISAAVDALRHSLGVQNVHFLRKDARNLCADDLPNAITIVFSQRFLHYLRFSEASSLIGILVSRLRPGAQLFLSVSGLNSELGEGYPARTSAIEERFARLAPKMAERHQIKESVCLYTEEDTRALANNHGLESVDVWSSAFGNVKGVFRKP
jgi:SAM-dependent methyltransferase